MGKMQDMKKEVNEEFNKEKKQKARDKMISQLGSAASGDVLDTIEAVEPQEEIEKKMKGGKGRHTKHEGLLDKPLFDSVKLDKEYKLAKERGFYETFRLLHTMAMNISAWWFELGKLEKRIQSVEVKLKELEPHIPVTDNNIKEPSRRAVRAKGRTPKD